jgi:ubiquinone/menaquinone biosynthesis C-methylase UbiE
MGWRGSGDYWPEIDWIRAAFAPSIRPVIYQHPLAYLLGVQGTALMRAFNGEYDREFTQARIAEVRALLDDSDARLEAAAAVRPITTAEGYDAWAPSYDEPNDLIDIEEPVIRAILDRRPAGRALDAACGTGRHAAYLASRGHEVLGVDVSANMLAVARAKLPGVDFRQADVCALPVPDEDVDLVVCSLALEHVPDLAAAFAEFRRVLRPGGHLVIADSLMEYRMTIQLPDGEYGYFPLYIRATSEYLTAALAQGLQVRHCEEVRHPWKDPIDAPPPQRESPGLPPSIWTLRDWIPAAHRAAYNDAPMLIFWDFERTGQ